MSESSRALDPKKPTVEDFQKFVELCVEIANLPLLEWLDGLNHGESVGLVLDPTRLRRYLYSPKAQFLKLLLGSALPLQQRIEAARRDPAIWQEFYDELIDRHAKEAGREAYRGCLEDERKGAGG